MCKRNASYLAKHSELGSKNLNKVCLKIIEKALKQPLQQRFPTFLSSLPIFDVTDPHLPKNKKKLFTFSDVLYSSENIDEEQKKGSSSFQMSCIPVKTPVKSKKKVFTFSHVQYSSAGSENPGEDGVIFQRVFDSPPENPKFPTGWEPEHYRCKFSKFFRVACLRTPLELFSFLNQLQICSAEKKIRLKKCESYAPPPNPIKISRYATAPRIS